MVVAGLNWRQLLAVVAIVTCLAIAAALSIFPNSVFSSRAVDHALLRSLKKRAADYSHDCSPYGSLSRCRESYWALHSLLYVNDDAIPAIRGRHEIGVAQEWLRTKGIETVLRPAAAGAVNFQTGWVWEVGNFEQQFQNATVDAELEKQGVERDVDAGSYVCYSSTDNQDSWLFEACMFFSSVHPTHDLEEGRGGTLLPEVQQLVTTFSTGVNNRQFHDAFSGYSPHAVFPALAASDGGQGNVHDAARVLPTLISQVAPGQKLRCRVQEVVPVNMRQRSLYLAYGVLYTLPRAALHTDVANVGRTDLGSFLLLVARTAHGFHILVDTSLGPTTYFDESY